MEALRIPLIKGRRFTDGDSENAPGVAIISATMAQRYWPDRDPIGERIWFDGIEPREHWLTIVGIAADVQQSGLSQPPPPIAYVCYSQLQIPAYLGSHTLVVRWKNESAVSPSALRSAIRSVHPEAAISFDSLDDVLLRATARERFQMTVLTLFAAIALALAIIGLYGVLANIVTSNQSAIGIRMALGASRSRIFTSLAMRGLRLSTLGCAIGLSVFLSIRRLMTPVLSGIGPVEPSVIGGACLLMLFVSLAACWFPARKATQIDPANVLHT